MLIEGFGLAGYGSFGEEIQKIGPLRKINLFIGQNNSGKSNLLLFLRRRYESLITSISSNSPNNIGFDPLEVNQGRNPGQIDFLLAYEKKGKSCQQLLESLKPILARQRIPMRD